MNEKQNTELLLNDEVKSSRVWKQCECGKKMVET